MSLDGWNENKKLQLTIAASDIDSELVNFPALIRLQEGAGSGINGFDCSAFFDELGTQSVDDDFTGEDGSLPNELLWRTNDATIAELESNALKILGPIQSLYYFDSDFGVQIEANCEGIGTDGDYAQISAYDISESGLTLTDGVFCRRSYSTAFGHRMSSGVRVDGAWATLDNIDVTDTDVNVKLRLVREGLLYSAYYDIGSGWVLISTFLTDTVKNVYIWSECNINTFPVDNFKVTSGTVMWPDPTFNKRIAFEYNDTGQQCFAEIESWDDINKKATLHVNIPEVSSTKDTALNLYYDRNAPDNDVIVTTLTVEEASDDFTGTDGDAPDELLWVLNSDKVGGVSDGATITIQGNKLRITSDGINDGSFDSTFTITGDCDLEFDFDFSNSSGFGTSDYKVIAYLWNNLENRTFFGARGDGLLRAGSKIDDVWETTQEVAYTDTSGSFRIIRSGDVYSALYKMGSDTEWTTLTSSTACITDDVSFSFLFNINSASGYVEVDNFKINSADTIIKNLPLSDDFTGTDGDSPRSDLWSINDDLWKNGYADAPVVIDNNRLAIGGRSTQDKNWGQVQSRFLITGNFDVQVDCDASSVASPYSALYIWSDLDNRATIAQQQTNFVANASVVGVWDTEAYVYEDLDVSSLRAIRVGSVLSFYCLVYGLWVHCGDFNWLSTSVTVMLHANTTDETDHVTYFDNFVINHAEGITGYVGDTGSFPAQQVWNNNFSFVSHMAQDPSGGAGCVLDSTSNSNNGTPSGTMLSEDLIDGLTGKLIEFDGVDDFIDFGNNTVFDNTSKFTVEFSFVLREDHNDASDLKVLVDKYNTFVFYLDTDGKLTHSHYGGNIKSTKDSWIAGIKYYVTATYNSAGTDGKLYVYDLSNGTGGEETLTNDTLIALAVSTNNVQVAIQNSATGPFPGSVGFVSLLDEVKSADEIAVTALSLMDDLFVFSIAPTGMTVDFIQNYAFINGLLTEFVQQYGISAATLTADFIQTYGLSIVIDFIQSYGDCEALLKEFVQNYRDKSKYTIDFVQDYGESIKIILQFAQKYNIRESMLISFIQKYNISAGQQVIDLIQKYDIKNTTSIITEFTQPYRNSGLSTFNTSNFSITINGNPIKVLSISGLRFSRYSYCGFCNLAVPNKQVFKNIEYLDPVVVTVNGTVFNFVVGGKEDSETIKAKSYTIKCMSPAIKLDYPYATEIEDDSLVAGTASIIVSNIAALEGLSVVWNMESNPTLTSDDVQISGGSPREAIRSIVNELGGKIHSQFDGTITIDPNYVVDSDKFLTTTPSRVYRVGKDFKSISSYIDKRNGYNKYSITDSSSTDGYSLSSEEISSSRHNIKASRVPWSDQAVILTTSEKTNVFIYPKGITTEVIEEEDIQITNGAGGLSNTCYEIISVDYGTRDNLGSVSFDEDGTITTSVSDDTLVNIAYRTKYWCWEIYGTDNETVQFSLEIA